MWAQLITMRLKPGKDTAEVNNQLRAAGAARIGTGPDAGDARPEGPQPGVHAGGLRERGQSTRAREQDPRRQEALQAARAMMAGIFDGPPQFTDLTVADEWTG